MSSRNSQRTAHIEPALEDPNIEKQDPDAPEQPSAVIHRTANTELVTLPSRGAFYTKDHPLCGKDSIEIRYMTARDEDILTSPSLLKRGTALDRFVDNIIVTPGVKSDQLLVGDKAAVMIAARVTGYGADYESLCTCPECDSQFENSFDLEDYEKFFIYPDLAETPFSMTKVGTFETTLPLTGKVVEVKLLTAADEKKITKSQQMKQKNNLQDSVTTDFLKSIVVSIDGKSSLTEVKEEIFNMPARDSRFLRKNYSSLVPNVDMKDDVECPYCGAISEMEVGLGASFFWPDI